MSENKPAQEFHATKEFVNFGLFAPAPKGEGRTARLVWGCYRGNPRITIWTGMINERRPINARMDADTFTSLMFQLERLARGEIENGAIENDTIIKTEDPNNKEHTLDTVTLFGRDQDGLCWICIEAKDRPKVVFHFKIKDFHRIRINKEPLSPSAASSQALLAHIDNVKSAMQSLMRETKEFGGTSRRTESEDKPAKSSSKNESSYFDDLP